MLCVEKKCHRLRYITRINKHNYSCNRILIHIFSRQIPIYDMDYIFILLQEIKKTSFYCNIIAPVTIVVEVAVAREGDQRSAADTERIKDLRSGIRPHLGVFQHRKVGHDIPQNAFIGAV